MVEVLGIATELAERRKRIAALQSPSVAARIVPARQASMSDEIKRLTAENGRLAVENARLTEELNDLRGIVDARQGLPVDLREMSHRAAANRILKVFARHYGVHPGDLISAAKDKHIVRARYAVYRFFLRDMNWSMASVARELRRDRSTIEQAKKRIDGLWQASLPWRQRYEDAVTELLGAPAIEEAA